MPLKLQHESPSDYDLFEGESHKKVSTRMAEVLRKGENNIVGLEGELGSGKSTIINFLKKELDSEFKFIDFDAERYHYGNTKKALIDVIYKRLSEIPNANQSRLDNYRNHALGNIVEYEKKVNSRLSWWTVLFILFSLLAVQMIRYILVDINTILTTEKPISKYVFIVELIGLLSPCFILGALAWNRRKSKKSSKNAGVATVGDLFKRNSVDKISETWLVNREVGTIELHDALSGFTDSLTLPQNARFILIIDNLDRIIPDKVKELWSDMELISGTTHEQFRIVIPYSARQVALSLAVEGHSGRDFIAKRIPVTFSVPPLITAGWQDAFKKMWQETVCENDEGSCIEAIQLLERWRPSQYPRVTPRLLKKFVNDIYILNLTVPSGEPYRFILIALYILMVRYRDYDIRELLRSPSAENIHENGELPPDENSEKFKANYRQLNRIFNNDITRWSEFLMSVHYQANAELARSELIDTPLVEAINAKDPSALESLINLWGFSHAWIRNESRIDVSSWLETVVKMPEEKIDFVTPQIQIAIQQLNAGYALTARESFNRNFTDALLKLSKIGKIIHEPFMMRQRNFLIKGINALQRHPEQNESDIRELLAECDFFSNIFNENLLDELTVEQNGEVFAKYLLQSEDIYPNLKINTISLNEVNIEIMMRVILDDLRYDIFSPGIIRHFGLASETVKEILKNESNNIPKNVVSTLTDIMQSTIIENYSIFRKLIFNNEWHTSSMLPYIASQTEIKKNYPVEFAAHVVAHMVETKNYTGIEAYNEYIGNEEYSILLSNYFIYSKSFDTVMDAVSVEQVAPFVSEAIKILFMKNKLAWLSPITYVKKHYTFLKENISDTDLLMPVVGREDNLINSLNLKSIEEISEAFIDDLYDVKTLQKTRNKIFDVLMPLFNSDNIYQTFKVITPKVRRILSKMHDAGTFISLNPDVNMFAEWYRTVASTELAQGVNTRFVWSLLNVEQQQQILAQAHDVLLEVQTSQANRVKMIHDLNDVLFFKEPEGKGSRRGIGALFNLSDNDELLRNWLDSQVFSFGNWPADESHSVSQIILERRDMFTQICTTSVFIKNRIKEADKE